MLSEKSRFFVSIRGSCRSIALRFDVEKLEWCGYPMVKKIDDMLTRFDTIHECDRQTDGRTLRDGIGRAYA